MVVEREKELTDLQRARDEEQKSRNRNGREVRHGSTGQPGLRRAMGAATKDNRHGVHTDHTDSRRSESRRDGHMGRESQSKQHRKNI